MAVVGVIASCDTKYHEVQFVQKKIKMSGNSPLILDVSTGPHIPMRADVSREEILAMGGYTWEQVHAMDKSGAIAAMTESISKMLLKLVGEKKIDGVMGMGCRIRSCVLRRCGCFRSDFRRLSVPRSPADTGILTRLWATKISWWFRRSLILPV